MTQRFKLGLLTAALIGAAVGCDSKDSTPASSATPSPATSAVSTSPTRLRPPPTRPVLPALSLRVEVSGEPVYVGDPLIVTVRLISPRARNAAYWNQRQREDRAAPSGTSRPAPTSAPSFDWPKISANWTTALSVSVFHVEPDGSHKPIVSGFDWSRSIATATMVLEPSGQWVVPPNADLSPGHYVLRATWNGAGLPEAPWWKAGTTLSEELPFEVVSADAPEQLAAHGQRLAAYLFQQKKYAEARQAGRQALASQRPKQITPDCFYTYLVVAESSAQLNEIPAAIEVLETLLPKLPRDSELQESVKDRLKSLRVSADAASRPSLTPSNTRP